MKPLKLNMSKFKKIGGDKLHTVMRHDDGHEIRIAHKALSPEARKQMIDMPVHEELKKVPKMADGGEVKKPKPSPAPSEIPKKDAEDFVKGFNNPDPIVRKAKEIFGMAEGGEAEAPAEPTPMPNPAPSPVPSPEAPPAPVPAAQPVINVNVSGQHPAPQAPQQGGLAQAANAPIQAPQQADPYGTQAQSNALMQGIALQRQGLVGQAQAQSKVAADEAKALQAQQKAISDAQTLYKSHFDEISKHQDEVIQQIGEQKIDPSRFWHDKSTLSKVGTIIGLIMGGAGGGENMALKSLQNSIDRDIEAQKAEMNKKQTLLGAYNMKLGNIRDATDMTRLMLNASVQNQLQLAAAKQGGPLAQSMAAQAIGKLNAENANIIGQMSLRKSLLSGANSGMVDPAKVVNFIVPEGQRAAANKELQEMQGMTRSRDNLLSAFDKLSKINTVFHGVTSPVQTSKQLAAIKDPLVAQLSKETAGRFTEQDAKFIDSLFPAKGDSAETLATKRAQMVKLISEKMNFPILQTYGIQVPQMRTDNKIEESAPVLGK